MAAGVKFGSKLLRNHILPVSIISLDFPMQALISFLPA